MASTSEPIELRRARDFNEQVNITTEFIRQNYRKLGRSLLVIAGGPIALNILFAMADAYTTYGTGGDAEETGSVSWFLMIASWIVMFIASFITVGVVNSYVFLYLEHGPDGFEVRDVWRKTKSALRSIFSLSFVFIMIPSVATEAVVAVFEISEVLGLLLIAGLLPAALYIMVVMMPVYTVRLYEGGTFFEVVRRSRELVQGRWWLTCKLLGLFHLLLVPIIIVLALPSSIVVWASDPHTGSVYISAGLSLLLIVLAMLSTFAISLFGSVLSLVEVLHYFNLVEKKEGIRITEQIAAIGTERDGAAPDTTVP